MAGRKRIVAKVGRPTKYRMEMCEQVIEAGRQGKTVAGMAAEIGITRETFNQWRRNKPEFSDAVKEGLDLAQAWWEDRGQEAVFGKVPGFNATAYIFNMKNRFKEDWRDTQDLTSSDGSMSPQKLTGEDLIKELERLGLPKDILEE